MIKTWAKTLATVAMLFGILSTARAVEFQESIEAARKKQKDLPIVLTFGAPWCGWCRKMTSETLSDKRVETLGGKFQWVKIDIDDEQELAARYRVRGVPHTAVLDSQNRIIASASGFMPPEKFVAFLQDALENPQPEEDAGKPLDDLVEKLKTADLAADGRATLIELVELLSRPDRAGRKQILTALSEKGTAVWPLLFELMSDRRLSVRAAAGFALAHVTRANFPFHPFAAADVREKQLAVWQVWLTDKVPATTKQAEQPVEAEETPK